MRSCEIGVNLQVASDCLTSNRAEGWCGCQTGRAKQKRDTMSVTLLQRYFMALKKAAIQEHKLTISLTEEEYELLQEFADEQDIQGLRLAVPAMIHALNDMSEQLWDSQFSRSPELLKKMAQKALDEQCTK